MRLAFVQHAGDFRETIERFAQGGKQTYYAQRYSVDFVASLVRQLEQVSVICGMTDVRYDVRLKNGVRAIGGGFKSGFHPSAFVELLEQAAPTRLCLTTPVVPALKWAKRNRVRTIAPFADSFRRDSVRAVLWQRRLASYLNHPIVDWVGNHGIAACISLQEIGVERHKIVPWDWPPSHQPKDYNPRKLVIDNAPKLIYVGSISESKGVGDLLEAMAILRSRSVSAKLSVVGHDRDGEMMRLARRLDLSDLVNFVGVLANEEVPSAMRRSDIVVIPSWHEYPEGLPLTIYEALATRTPIIASDHPMFRGSLVNRESALIYPARQPERLADAICQLVRDPETYARLSANCESAWKRVQLPVRWGELIQAWLSDDQASAAWISNHSLSSGLYDSRIRDVQDLL